MVTHSTGDLLRQEEGGAIEGSCLADDLTDLWRADQRVADILTVLRRTGGGREGRSDREGVEITERVRV